MLIEMSRSLVAFCGLYSGKANELAVQFSSLCTPLSCRRLCGAVLSRITGLARLYVCLSVT